MRKAFVWLALASVCAAQIHEITGPRIRAHVKFLASDRLEGRGVGTRGGELTEDYLATQLALFGIKPAGDRGTYFQTVPMIGVTTQPGAGLTIRRNGQTLNLNWAEEFVGTTQRQVQSEEFEADAVYVGHGIVAPEYNWNDYKDVDVTGRFVVLFTNEPRSEDPALFGGKALTYYGRWTYKYEQALRQGARGVLIVHTTPTAGYGWDVVRSSWGKEDPQMTLQPGQPALGMAGWITQQAGERLFTLAGKKLDELLNAADSRDFRPIPLGLRIRAKIPASLRPVESRNVVGIVPGSDPEKTGEAVVFSAHWDHLGIGTPVEGDKIYNGAVDNATGCGLVLEIARAWSQLARKPRRSAVFLFVTAEESGLRGSEFYGRHPAIPAARTTLNLNYDALFPLGRTRDVVVTGAERTTAWPLVQEMARRFQLEIKPDPRPEQGSYYRSDHFSLARVGIPAFTIKQGNEFLGQKEGYGGEAFRLYNTKRYHQPSDEFEENWNFAGLEHMGRFGFSIGLSAAERDTLFTWNPGDEFRSAREQSQIK